MTPMPRPAALLAPLIAGFAGLALASHAAVTKRVRETELEGDQRIVQAIDSERERIQRDLHDTAQQRIVSIRLRLGTLALSAYVDRSAIATIGEDLDAALAEIRAVTISHSPDVLWRDGLPAALRRVAARAPLPVVIDAAGLGRLAPHVERQVYFTCLEALQNAYKHSGARHAWVRFRRRADRLGFEIVDDGRGFDPSLVVMGQGFSNMAYRLSALGGRLSMVASPGSGTSVRGEVPIAPSAPDQPQLVGSVRLPARSAGRPATGPATWT
jgi:signal transduction histidine kinase